MKRLLMSLVLLCTACGAGATSAQALPLLGPEDLKDGRTWQVTADSKGRWRDLGAELVPCGKPVIVAADDSTRWRVLTAGDGSVVSQVLVSDVDAMNALKRFFAECDAKGTSGPKNVASLNGEVEVAAGTKRTFAVVGGTLPEADLVELAERVRVRMDEQG